MIPKDCFEQILDEPAKGGVDFADDMTLLFYEAKIQGETYNSVSISMDKGIVECYNKEELIKSLAIKCTLEPITT